MIRDRKTVMQQTIYKGKSAIKFNGADFGIDEALETRLERTYG